MTYPQAFIIANAFTQKWEKGYVNHPKDPGGATFNGVSLRFLKQTGIDINGDGHIDAKDIRTLYERNDQAAVDSIFHKGFWEEMNLRQFEVLSIQVVLYDTGVNTGRTQAIRCLQRACNILAGKPVLKVDGVYGSRSMILYQSQIYRDLGPQLTRTYLTVRLDFHNMLVQNSPYPDGRDYRPFAKGWRNRVNDLMLYVKNL